jgi:hypothetical protein
LIISHSTLFYWWPVWAVGYLAALITLIDGHFMAIVPSKTEVAHVSEDVSADLKGKQENKRVKMQGRDVLVPQSDKEVLDEPDTMMAKNKNVGVIFIMVLLLVIAITNIPLRGWLSVLVIVVIVLGSVTLAAFDKWKVILSALGFLDIRINLAGYIMISSVILALWLVAMLLFDRQIYMIFTPGQLRVRLEIGEGETTYDTRGMTFQKQRSDLFRHWILGLGSGDLIVKTAGAQAHQFDFPNVLFVGRKVKLIEEMMRTIPRVGQE